MAHPQRSASVQLRDGATLHYTIYGDEASGQLPAVLVHSLALAGVAWEPVATCLARQSPVLTFDCRGHGASSKTPGPYRLPAFAHDLADLLDSLGWTTIDLVGASMGGSVSLQFTALYPQRVRSLGLVDTTAWYGPDAPARWEQRARQAEEHGLAALLDFQESRWFSEAFRAENGEAVQRCRTIFQANDVTAFAATCRMLGAFDLRDALPAMRQPTAIIVGEEDYATPVAMAQVLHNGIVDSTLQVIPKRRHLTFVECPEIVTAALSGLRERASPQP